MNSYTYTLSCSLNLNPADLDGIEDTLEITIPCSNCQRINRTIIFEGAGTNGICTPSEKCSGFPGKLIERKIITGINSVQIKHRIEFEYDRFIDKKYGVESSLDSTIKWARIYFTIKCSSCGTKAKQSTQENIVRPSKYTCQCGRELYDERVTPFEYQIKMES